MYLNPDVAAVVAGLAAAAAGDPKEKLPPPAPADDAPKLKDIFIPSYCFLCVKSEECLSGNLTIEKPPDHA